MIIMMYFLVRVADLRSGAELDFLMPSRASDKIKRRKAPEPYTDGARRFCTNVSQSEAKYSVILHSVMMASNNNIIIAFDLYGTLLSTESIAKELSTHFGKDKAAGLAGLWRRYQLEYTWRLNSMGMHYRSHGIVFH